MLARTAKDVRNYRVRKKILITALICQSLVVAMIYEVAALYKKTGSFTVSVDKYEMTKYGLTLSESRDMKHNSSYLNAKIYEQITNNHGEFIPLLESNGFIVKLDHFVYTEVLEHLSHAVERGEKAVPVR